jgi:tricorn protease
MQMSNNPMDNDKINTHMSKNAQHTQINGQNNITKHNPPIILDDSFDRKNKPQHPQQPCAQQKITITVLPSIGKEKIIYREWVEKNRHFVKKISQGRVGYIHIPNMGTEGCAEFFRYYPLECKKDALIIDVRFNKGGNLTNILISYLLRPQTGLDRYRLNIKKPFTTLFQSAPKIQVTLCNSLSASDGDIFPYTFSTLKLGPVIGQRTWGGTIGIWPRHNLLNNMMIAAPEFENIFNTNTLLENFGFTPDIEIKATPGTYATDPYLEEALKYIQQKLTQEFDA